MPKNTIAMLQAASSLVKSKLFFILPNAVPETTKSEKSSGFKKFLKVTSNNRPKQRSTSKPEHQKLGVDIPALPSPNRNKSRQNRYQPGGHIAQGRGFRLSTYFLVLIRGKSENGRPGNDNHSGQQQGHHHHSEQLERFPESTYGKQKGEYLKSKDKIEATFELD